MQERKYDEEFMSEIYGVRSPLMEFEAMPNDRCDMAVVVDRISRQTYPAIVEQGYADQVSGDGTIIHGDHRYEFDYGLTFLKGEPKPYDFSLTFKDPMAEQKVLLKRNLYGNNNDFKKMFQDLSDSIELVVIKSLMDDQVELKLTVDDPVKLEREDDGSFKVLSYGQEIGTIETSDVIADVREAVYQAMNEGSLSLDTDDINITKQFIGDVAEDFSERYSKQLNLDPLQKFALQEEFHEKFWGDAVDVLQEARAVQWHEMSNERELA